MSLLMQALKKAERAKQNSGEAELEKPSEAFDELLALTPQPPTPAGTAAAAPAAAPASAPAPSGLSGLSLEPMAGLSLTPMGDGAAASPAPSAPPAPASAGLDFASESLPPIPVLNVAEEAIHDPVPPQARHHAEAGATPAAAPAEAPATARVKAELKADMASAAATAAAAPEAAAKGARASKGGKEGGAAAARARAAASSSGPGSDMGGMDPAKLRIAGLAGIVLLILLGYGYYFWQAVYGPGSGSRLPMVPMPPPNATGATSGVVVVPGAGGAPNKAAPATAPSPDEEAQPSETQRAREAALAAQLAALQATLQQQQMHSNAPDTLPPVAAPESSEVKVVRTAPEPKVDPALSGGYEALSSGDVANARTQYDAALRQDPNNRDALLGTAAVALRQNQQDKAGAAYARLLQLDPNDPDALAGLAGLRQGDPGQTEQRLNAALRSAPDSGPVLFALGNLYARQGRWPEAQQSYFRAYSAVPTNADYAFNLAVGLDRLNQGKLALAYYQKALALGQDKPASFDRDAVHRRMQELTQAAAR